MEDGNKKHYFIELKNEEIVGIFNALTAEDVPVKVWREGQDKDEAGDYFIKGFDSHNMYVTLSKQDKWFGLLAAGNAKKKLFFRFGGEGLLTFTTGVLVGTKGEYRLDLKESVFRCQMRNHYRLVGDSYNKMGYQVDGEILHVFDLSASGVGVLISKSQKKRFRKGALFKNSAVLLNGESYSISRAEVVSVWEERTAFFKTTGNLEVGFKFVDLEADDEEGLSRQIHTLAWESEVRKALLQKAK